MNKYLRDDQIRIRAYAIHQILKSVTIDHRSFQYGPFEELRQAVKKSNMEVEMRRHSSEAYGLMHIAYRRSLLPEELDKLTVIEAALNAFLPLNRDQEREIDNIGISASQLEFDDFKPLELNEMARNHFKILNKDSSFNRKNFSNEPESLRFQLENLPK